MKTLQFLLSMENNILLGFDLIGSFSKFSNVHFSREILAWFTPSHVQVHLQVYVPQKSMVPQNIHGY